MSSIRLSGLALRTHNDETYPFDVDPYAHQQSMRRLICDHSRFVAVNDSPTGGGKTSSWLAPALETRRDVIAVYPTNSLVADQYEAIQRKTDEAVTHDVAVIAATSDRLHELRDEYNVASHGAVLDRRLREAKRANGQCILLTNPDILVMLRRDLYRNPVREYKNFEAIVVDEFHRANRKEQNTLRYLLDEMQSEDEAIVGLRQVAFLSATPEARQEQLFEDAMTAPYQRVTKQNGNERRAFTNPPSGDWRPAMPPIKLDVRTAPTFGTAGVLINKDEAATLSFCRDGRTVIMLDGIHEVGRVYTWLNKELSGNIERIDGFHGENKADKLSRFDVLVSNSAVEVGIDFDVEQILFAGHNRDSFLQRLGRLRSEADWRRARCYVPQATMDPLAARSGTILTRTELDELLAEAYPTPRQPATFDAKYSAAEAFEHLDTRLKNAPTDDHEQIKQSSLDRIRRHFNVGPGTKFSLQDMERFTETLDWRVLTALQWYRGDSIQAAVYDRTTDRLTTYNLFYLLRYGDVEFFDLPKFRQRVPDAHIADIDRHARYVDAFCIYHGTIETNDEGYGRNVYFTGPVMNSWLNRTTTTGRKPQIQSGLEIGVEPNGTGSRVESITKVNERFRNRGDREENTSDGILCYTVSGTPKTVQRRYELGDFFFLYPVQVQDEDMHSLAIGTDALYLHCHVTEQQSQLLSDDDNTDLIGGI